MFLLFNQLQRHAGVQKLNAAVKNNTRAIEEFKELSKRPTFLAELKEADEDGSTKKAIELTAKLERIVCVISPLIPCSGAARRNQLGAMIARVRFFGPPTLFPTISPDPVGSPVAIRATLATFDNHSFPATDSGFVVCQEWVTAVIKCIEDMPSDQSDSSSSESDLSDDGGSGDGKEQKKV